MIEITDDIDRPVPVPPGFDTADQPGRGLLEAGGRGPECAVTPTVVFELRRRDTGGLVHAYRTEGAALAFVRDVIFIGGRDQAACFALEMRDELGQIRTLAEGLALIQRALEDRAE